MSYYEYDKMKKLLDKTRSGFRLLEVEQQGKNVIGYQDNELTKRTLDSEGSGTKITLDDNKVATITTDNNSEISENILEGMQQILNGFMETLRGAVLSIDLMTVNIGDSSVGIAIQVTMDDQQPATLHINSDSQTIQLKYDNFLELTDKNILMMSNAKRYFNPNLMSKLQGLVTAM